MLVIQACRMAALLLLLLPSVAAIGESQKYLFASSPSTGYIGYMLLPHKTAPPADKQPMHVLIDSGLSFPQGLAVDEFRHRLYVADPGLGKLVYFDISLGFGQKLDVGEMRTVAENVETRAVAVDGLGNVFFTEEPSQKIYRVAADDIDAGKTKAAQVVYAGSNTTTVSSPGGIAMDNFFVYWVNKASGNTVGTLVRGLHSMSTPVTLASNAPKCYGLCLAAGNVFYTDDNSNLYGISRSSTSTSTPVTISSTLKQPRGCTYDGLGTIYVADKAQNAIYYFAANMPQLLPERVLSKVADMQGPFGLAVYNV